MVYGVNIAISSNSRIFEIMESYMSEKIFFVISKTGFYKLKREEGKLFKIRC